MSKLLHGMRITLLCTVSTTLVCHLAIAKNKPNKTPGNDEGGGNVTYAIAQKSSPNSLNHNAYTKTEHLQQPSSSANTTIQIPGPAIQSLHTLPGNDKLESFSLKLQSYNILQNVQQKVNATDEDFKMFVTYYYDRLFADDRAAFWKLVESNKIQNDADVQNYASQKTAEYVALYQSFVQIKRDYPSSVSEQIRTHSTHSAAAMACNPACDNIDFETGDLSAWSAYYAANTSSTTAFNNSAPTGGACGAVTKAALDPATNTYQVSLTSGAGLDPVAGALIPVVCPTGGTHSCRIGDSTRNGAQMGILQQTFTVTNSNCDFIYMYAAVLENPGHNYFQQPYFNVQMLDQNGNPIPNCGNYSVVSGPGLPGYKSVYYKPNADTVYCKPWTTVFVPLKAYIGQCITIKITTSDCALGGHFGYAYFDAVCSVSLITSSPAVCKGSATLTGPSGVSSYKWLGPCIIGSNTNQTVTVGCNGTYKVVISSIANAACSDTLSITLPLIPPPSLTVTGTNINCNGANNGTATATVTGGASPYTYKWSPGGNTTSSVSNLSPGTYTVTVYDTTGCGDTATVTITEPSSLVVTIASHHDLSCSKSNDGAVNAAASGGTSPYAYLWSNGKASQTSAGLSAGTYWITVTDANGCTAKDSVYIGQPPPLVVTSTVTAVLCNGGSTGQATANASGGHGFYTYQWNTSPKQSNATATGLSAGTYIVTVTDSAGCSGADTIIVTEPAALAVTASSTSNVSCNGGNTGSAIANASGGTAPYKYNWSSGSSSASASNLAAGTYTVTVTDANGCTATATTTITQPATVLSATISSLSNISCNGNNNGSATISASGGTSPYNYLWSNASAATTISNLSPGTYSVTVTDANSCTASASVSITQPAVLVASVSSGIEVSCFGGNDGAATALVTGGSTPYNYNWSSGSLSATASNLTAGTYSVTVTDANGCTSSSSVTIIQPSKLTATIGTPVNVSCNGGNNGSASVTAGGGTTPYNYSWSTGSSATSINNLAAGTYNVTITDVKGCSATASVTITEPAPLAISFTSTNPTCFGVENGSASALVSGGASPYKYAWSTVPVQSTQSANGLGAGSYTVTITDANGCTANNTVTLTQPAKLVATITGSANATCYGYSNGSATASVSGGTSPYNYSWTTKPLQTTPTANGLSAGTYTVAASDAQGCTSTASVTISAPAKIVTTVTGPDTICAGTNVTLTASTSGGNGTYAYHWSNGGGPASSINVSPASNTTYTVTATDGNGCKGDTASIKVTSLMLTAAAVNVSPSQTSCAGDTLSIFATVNTTNSGNVTVLWSNGNTTLGPFKVAPTTTTTYTIKVSDKCGNTVSKSVTITVNPLPVMNLPAQSGAACTSVTLNFTDSNAANAGDSYYWTFSDDKSTSTNSSVSHTYDESGRYVVDVTVTSAQGCKTTAQAFMNIDIYPTAKANFSVSPNRASVVNPTIAFTDNSLNTTQWFWNFGDGGTSRVQNPTHTYPPVVAGYKVDLITNNSWGCKDSASDSVYIIPDFRIFIPNAFSPNADGVNEYFTAKGIGIEKFNMMIFDRWGNLLYTTDDINRGWNGTVGGGKKVAEEDTYVYKIEVTDIFKDQHSYIGAVTLIK